MKLKSTVRKFVRFIFELRNLSTTSSSYDNLLLAEVVTKKTELFIAQRKEKLFPNSNYLALIAAISSDNSIRNIIDFGGAAGIHYHLVNYLFPNLKSWNVLETKAMVEANKGLMHPILKFFSLDTSEKLKIDCDLLYSSSSIQYTANPTETLKQLLSFNPKHILISRTPFTEGNSSVSFTQHSLLSQNGPGALPESFVDSRISYQVHIPILTEVQETLSEKFEIQWIVTESEDLKDSNGNSYPYLSIFATRK